MSEDEISIPDLVDEPFHFLIWQFDEIITVTVGLIVGIVVNSPGQGLFVGLLVRHQYLKMRDGKPKGYIVHRLREMGLAFDRVNEHSSMQTPLVNEYHS